MWQSNKIAWTWGSLSAEYGGEASLLDTGERLLCCIRYLVGEPKFIFFFLYYHITRNRGVHIHDYWDCPKELNTRGGQQSQHVQSQNRGGEPHYKAVCKDFYPKTGVHRSTNIYLVKLSKQVKRRPGSRLAKLEQKLDAT